MAARKARKPKYQKSECPTLPGQLGYLNSYYCPVCGKHLFSAYDKDMKKDREDGITSMCQMTSTIAANAGSCLTLTNGREKKNRRKRQKN